MLKPLSSAHWTTAAAAHLLNRAGFGGAPADIEALAALGLDGAVDRLVDWQKVPEEFPAPAWTVLDVEARAERFRKFREATAEERQQLQREEQRERREQMLELQGWWLRRMATSPRPLQEKLTLFWHGHFATAIEKVRDPYLMWRQNEMFRAKGAGEWLDLLDEVTRDPAMLIYLDQHQSRLEHPNENYARELMELFTLGEGNYSEKDVTEAARAFTGLTLDRLTLKVSYNTRRHDAGEKAILGRTGKLDGWDVLEHIAGQRQSARFIVAKLWSFFAAENPSPELVAALAESFEQGGRRFAPLLRTLFRSEEFYSAAVVRRQIKSPVQLLVQACRQLERDLPPPAVMANALRLLGQSLFAPPNVKGWDGGVAWINTNTLLTRHNLALMLVSGEGALPFAGGRKPQPKRMGRALDRMPKGSAPVARLLPPVDRRDAETLLASVERRLIGARFKDKDRAALLDYVKAQGELDVHELAGLLRLAMCTPDYQLC